MVLKETPHDWTTITFRPLFEPHGMDLVLQEHDHAYGRGGQQFLFR